MRFILIGGQQEECRACVEPLVKAGHEVAAYTGTPEEAEPYLLQGAKVAVGSCFDLRALEQALGRYHVVVFFGTVAPRRLIPAPHDLIPYDRFRREAIRVVCTAAVRQRVRLLIAVSTAGVYGDRGEQVVDESTPVNPPALLQSFADMEEEVCQSGEFHGLPWVILRLGMVWSAHAWHTRRVFSLIRQGHTPPLASQRGFISPVHAEDVAQAVVAAATRSPPGETFNVVDDMPIRFNKLLQAVAKELKAKPPGSLPSFLLRLSVGKALYEVLRISCRADNSRAKRLLRWQPRYRSLPACLAAEIALWKKVYGPVDSGESPPAPSPGTVKPKSDGEKEGEEHRAFA